MSSILGMSSAHTSTSATRSAWGSGESRRRRCGRLSLRSWPRNMILQTAGRPTEVANGLPRPREPGGRGRRPWDGRRPSAAHDHRCIHGVSCGPVRFRTNSPGSSTQSRLRAPISAAWAVAGIGTCGRTLSAELAARSGSGPSRELDVECPFGGQTRAPQHEAKSAASLRCWRDRPGRSMWAYFAMRREDVRCGRSRR